MGSDAGPIAEILSHMQQIARDSASTVPIGLDGVIIGYNPADGTVSVVIGSSVAAAELADEPFTQPVVLTGVQLSTHALGTQYGPVGGERVLIVPRESGWQAVLEHGLNDSPGAPAGEHWIAHTPFSVILEKDGELGGYTQFIKFTNDGVDPGDGLGGIARTSSSYIADATAGGWESSLSDTRKLSALESPDGATVKVQDAIDSNPGEITHTTAQGVVQHKMVDGSQPARTVMDGVDGEIAHVVSKVGLGDRFGSLPSSSNVIANTHLDTMISDPTAGLNALRLNDLEKLVAAMISAGVPNAGLILAQLASLVQLPVPDGSPSVRITT